MLKSPSFCNTNKYCYNYSSSTNYVKVNNMIYINNKLLSFSLDLDGPIFEATLIRHASLIIPYYHQYTM